MNAEDHDSYQYRTVQNNVLSLKYESQVLNPERLLTRNEQFDDDDIPTEMRARADLNKYLPREELADWVPMKKRKSGFTPEEADFRKK